MRDVLTNDVVLAMVVEFPVAEFVVVVFDEVDCEELVVV